jgi:pyruvate dehydrogenase E1 component
MSSFIAAGTAYATHGINTIPFFIYYSMFGMQRIGDLVWAAADMKSKGFMIGATSGRTTLAGEGLQHQDGQSHVLAYGVPNLKCYDPTFAYELAVIIQDGLERMYEKQENCFYYITVMNENYIQPPMPKEVTRESILNGMYKFRTSKKRSQAKAHLLGSGAILNEAIKAAEILESDYGVAADVWSVTSYKELHLDASETERWNMLNPDKKAKSPYIERVTKGETGVFVSASDYLQLLGDSISKWLPGPMHALGTYGFGRSETRESLRDFFEVDARYIAFAALFSLAKDGKITKEVLKKAKKQLEINADKPNPFKF